MVCLIFSVPDTLEEEVKPRTAPAFVSHPDSIQVEEGEWARFCCRVTGYPKPRVMWLINGHTVVNVSDMYSPIWLVNSVKPPL